jgi:cytochrome c biogenesis protein
VNVFPHEESMNEKASVSDKRNEGGTAAPSPTGWLDRFLTFLSSVPLGIVLMILLVVFSVLGTVIPQVTLENFDEFYRRLTPAERALWGSLGLFDLYHAWWFSGLMVVFALNLTLASIDIGAKALRFYHRPALTPSPAFLSTLDYRRTGEGPFSADVMERIVATCRSLGFRVRRTSEGERTTVFAERGRWIRFGGVVVHLSLVVILAGAFLGSRWGYEGIIALSPGTTVTELFVPGVPALNRPDERRPLPFSVICHRLWVELKNPQGPLTPTNVINWYTEVTIKDGDRQRRGVIKVNDPLDYRGHRFFQSGTSGKGDASRIVVNFIRSDGESQVVTLDKLQSVHVEGLGTIRFVRFLPDLRIVGDQLSSASDDYTNPAAELEIKSPEGETTTVWALGPEAAEAAATHPDDPRARLTLAGWRIVLESFDRVSREHIVRVQYDPGVGAVYGGAAVLILTLLLVFAFAHERLWVIVERRGDHARLILGGDTNRHHLGFERKFEAVVRACLTG